VRAVRGLFPLLLGLALLFPAAAFGEVVTPAADAHDAALGVRPDGSPVVGYVDGQDIMVATRRAGGWRSERIGRAPLTGGRVARVVFGRRGRAYVLVEHVDFGWLRLFVQHGASWRRVVLRSHGLGGPAGLTVDRAGRGVVAYATWSLSPSPRSTLFVVREQANGRFVTRQVTRNGFPPASRPPSATPVVLADGSLRILEAVGGGSGAVVLSWRRERGRWWGKVVYANTIALPVGPAFASPNGQTLDAAWSVLYTNATVEQVDALVGTPYPVSRSAVALTNAEAAGLVRGAAGIELAANEHVAGLFAGRVLAGDATTELDGMLLGFARGARDSRQLLALRDGQLEWFETPALLATRVTLTEPVPGTLAGRVAGASAGTVAIYDEAARPRALVATVPLAPDGTFTMTAPTGLYRAVYVDSATGVPYAAVER
jgi:hypothetical protein